MGRYLEPDPVGLDGDFNTEHGVDWYGYAPNNPINFIDQDGILTCQFRKDGQCNDTVRNLEDPLRKSLIRKCAKEKKESLVAFKQSKRYQPSPPPRPGARPDQASLDALKKAAAAACEKGAECEYQACVAGSTSGPNTTDYMRVASKCMQGG